MSERIAHWELAGLDCDIIAVPSGGDSGGDLSAVFFVQRRSLEWCRRLRWPWYSASAVAGMSIACCTNFKMFVTPPAFCGIERSIHSRSRQSDGPLRLTTVVTGTF